MVKNIGIKIMERVKNWVKEKAVILSIALSNVEKNAFGQNNEMLNTDINHDTRHSQGKLADSLINGEITQEVIDLRWRTYKILKATEGIISEITGYDDNDLPIVKTKKSDKKRGLENIKIDTYDSYPLEMVVENDDITIGVKESLENVFINVQNEATIKSETFIDTSNFEEKEEKIAIHGNITADDFFASRKPQRPIIVGRTFFTKFNIENFTKKLNVRTIDNKNKLIEFYVSVYPDDYNKTSKLFLNEIKKAVKNPIASNMLEIKEVGFITHKTTGADDFLEYKYEITSFDKIIEFNSFYVIKFLAKVVIDGNDILEQHRVVELDENYKNKKRKK
jgi:hypothetical protein